MVNERLRSGRRRAGTNVANPLVGLGRVSNNGAPRASRIFVARPRGPFHFMNKPRLPMNLRDESIDLFSTAVACPLNAARTPQLGTDLGCGVRRSRPKG
jgi:hypothetical protein